VPPDLPKSGAREMAREYLKSLELFEESIYLPPTMKKPRRKHVLPGSLEPLPKNLESFEHSISNCAKCPQGKSREHNVFGDGNSKARIVFVGEAPGAEEDKQGKPFVGAAGRLLNQLLEGVGLVRERDVYICNVLKCRPPQNRDPLPAEIETCSPYLLTQLTLIAPDIIVCLGRHAVHALLGVDSPMKALRGRVLPWEGMQVLVTYHPAYYLRNMGNLHFGEEDFQLLRRFYDESSKNR
jgi:uracil-DNA glycosylase family 4